jgi:hypothetical protein
MHIMRAQRTCNSAVDDLVEDKDGGDMDADGQQRHHIVDEPRQLRTLAVKDRTRCRKPGKCRDVQRILGVLNVPLHAGIMRIEGASAGSLALQV